MIHPTAVIVTPAHIDYPLMRYNLKRFQEYYDRVIIVRTQMQHGQEYLEYPDLPDNCMVLHCHSEEGDWRNNAVNQALNKARGEYILFLEPDFLMHFTFMDNVFVYARDFVYYKEGDRIHPAFAIVKRELIEKTKKDFSASPPKHDHFGLFFQTLWNKSSPNVDDKYHRVNINMFGVKEDVDYYHLAGLTQNYHCFREGQPFYKPDEFLGYNHLVQKLDIAQIPSFMKLSKEIEDKYGSGDTARIERFF